MSNAAAIIKEAREASQENAAAAPGSDPRGRKKPSRLPTIDPPKPKRAASPELNLPQWNRNPQRPALFAVPPSLRTEEPWRPAVDCVDRGLDKDKNLVPFLRLFRPSDKLTPLGEVQPAGAARAVSPKPAVQVPVPRTARPPAPAAEKKEAKSENEAKPERSKSAPKSKVPAPPPKGKPTRPSAAASSGPLVLEMPPHVDLQMLFDETDGNGSGALSLAELDKTVKVRWPTLDNKPAIMRAYKAADKDGTGFVTRDEFPYFIQYLVYHNNLFAAFKAADESGDRKLSREEFRDLARAIKVDDADATFDEMDENKGGAIMFDEFCAWIARNRPNMQIDGSIFPKKKPANQPKINKTKVDKKAQAEAKVAEQGVVKIAVPPEAECMALFDRLDPNGNGMLSLAELDKGVVELWPKLNNKPAIMRAYKAADKDGSGCVTRKEFGYFLRFLQYYNNLWADFMAADESGDRRITRSELKDAAKGLEIADPDAAFDEMDENKGGYVLFDEFCAWMAKNKSDWGSTEHAQHAAHSARSPSPPTSIPPTPPKSTTPVRTPTPPPRTPTPPATQKVSTPPRAAAPPTTIVQEAVEQDESNSAAIVLHDGAELSATALGAPVGSMAAGHGTVFAMHELDGNIGFFHGEGYLTAPATVGGAVTFDKEFPGGSPSAKRQQWEVEYLEDAVLFKPVCRSNEVLDVVNSTVVTSARVAGSVTQKCNLRLAPMIESPTLHAAAAAPPAAATTGDEDYADEGFDGDAGKNDNDAEPSFLTD